MAEIIKQSDTDNIETGHLAHNLNKEKSGLTSRRQVIRNGGLTFTPGVFQQKASARGYRGSCSGTSIGGCVGACGSNSNGKCISGRVGSCVDTCVVNCVAECSTCRSTCSTFCDDTTNEQSSWLENQVVQVMRREPVREPP